MSPWLTDRPLDAAALLEEVASPGCGGTSLFLGTVRSSAEDGDVRGIEYSSYPEMAEAEFDRMIAEARSRWPKARIALRHRTGFIATGEASIAIAVACPHRNEAFEACRYLIEETKKRAPVWKKEQLTSGGSRWVNAAGVPHA
jgi:molybdopterin synthase catalytic subunit